MLRVHAQVMFGFGWRGPVAALVIVGGMTGCGGLVDDGAGPGDEERDGNPTAADSRGAGDALSEPWWCTTCSTDFVSLISVNEAGVHGDGSSRKPTVSSEGHVIAYTSEATNLVAGDTNAAWDILLYDVMTGTTTRIVSKEGAQGDGDSSEPNISSDGSRVAFESDATNFGSDLRDVQDIFVAEDGFVSHVVSVATDGTPANDYSTMPAISEDGRFVVFSSLADNLVPEDTNEVSDIFIRDLRLGTTERVSVASDGTEANGESLSPDVSADGRYVVFSSEADNLVDSDQNETLDVFLHDRTTGVTRRISQSYDGSVPYGNSSTPTISADGSRIAFFSNATRLTSDPLEQPGQVFLSDPSTDEISLLSRSTDGVPSEEEAGQAELSADGSTVVYASLSQNLAPNAEWLFATGTEAVFVTAITQMKTALASRGIDCGRADWHANEPAVSGKGDIIAFSSSASNFSAGKVSEKQIFVARSHSP